MRTSILP